MGTSIRATIVIATFIGLLTPAASASAAGAVAQDRSSQALAAPPSCPTGLVCAWTGPNFTGRVVLIDPATIGACWGVAENEIFDSVWNAGASTVLAWESQFCWGRNVFISPGTGGNTRFPVRSFS
jgi:hypothetical protein